MNKTPDPKKQAEPTSIRKTFSQIPNWFFEVPKSVVSFPERNLIIWYASHDEAFTPCQATYAKKVELTVQAVNKCNRAMRKKGFIVRDGVNKYNTAKYTFIGWNALYDMIYPPETYTTKVSCQKGNTRKVWEPYEKKVSEVYEKKVSSKNIKEEHQTKNINSSTAIAEIVADNMDLEPTPKNTTTKILDNFVDDLDQEKVRAAKLGVENSPAFLAQAKQAKPVRAIQEELGLDNSTYGQFVSLSRKVFGATGYDFDDAVRFLFGLGANYGGDALSALEVESRGLDRMFKFDRKDQRDILESWVKDRSSKQRQTSSDETDFWPLH